MSSGNNDEGPPCQLLFRSKERVELFEVNNKEGEKDSPKKSVCLAQGSSSIHAVHPHGGFVLIHMTGLGVIRRSLGDGGEDADDKSLFLEGSEGVQLMDFSPDGGFVVTYERWKAEQTENVKVWDSATGKLLCGFPLKNLKMASWPSVQFTHDDKFMFHLANSEVHIYPSEELFGESKARYVSKIKGPIGTFSLPTTAAPGAAPADSYNVCVFIPEAKGKPARINLLRYPDKLDSASSLAAKSFYRAEDCSIRWAPKGDALLAHTQTSVDTSGQSYYGSAALYLLAFDHIANKSIAEPVPLPNDAQTVHDAQWSPNPNKPPCFVTISGKMPATSCLHHGSTAQPLFLFGNAHRNSVSFSPHARFINLAGFGNLAGDMAFWDRNKLKLIPRYDLSSQSPTPITDSVNASCTVQYGWSPDARTFFVSTTSPRMNVDNGVRLFTYAGNEITHEQLWNNDSYRPDKLRSVQFIPAKFGTYPDRPQSPPPKGAATDASSTSAATKPAPPTSKPAATARYVPPAARRAGASNSLADRLRAERESSTAASVGKVTKKPAVVGASPATRTPVGMAPPSNNDPNAKSKNAIRRERQKAAKARAAAAAEEEEAKKAAVAAAPPAAAADPEKRAKKIKKTLKQIQDLKEKDPGSLNEDQKKKLAMEQSLNEELSQLGL